MKPSHQVNEKGAQLKEAEYASVAAQPPWTYKYFYNHILGFESNNL